MKGGARRVPRITNKRCVAKIIFQKISILLGGTNKEVSTTITTASLRKSWKEKSSNDDEHGRARN